MLHKDRTKDRVEHLKKREQRIRTSSIRNRSWNLCDYCYLYYSPLVVLLHVVVTYKCTHRAN